MAQSILVTVNGRAFATVTTQMNATLLRDKINKTYAGTPAAVEDAPLLYNPKHLDALAALAERATELGLPTLVDA